MIRIHRRVRNSAFTIIELICLLGIIAVLIAMLLPAVQSVREAARKISCTSQLRQLGLGLLEFESAQGKFPPGTLGTSDTPIRTLADPHVFVPTNNGYYIHDYQNTSWIALILSSIGGESLHDQLPRICRNENQSYRRYRSMRPQAAERLIDNQEVQEMMKRKVPLLIVPVG